MLVRYSDLLLTGSTGTNLLSIHQLYLGLGASHEQSRP